MHSKTRSRNTDTPLPISFSPDGFDGFRSLRNELVSAELLVGRPVGADHVFFERREMGLVSGIWRSEPYEERYASYPNDEFMYMLRGEVTVGNDAREWVYKTGDAFLIPRGFRGYWRQRVPVEKYYVIIGAPAGETDD